MHSTRPTTMRQAWERTVRGDRRWGSLAIHADRMGVTRYRLVMYPPGITEAERRDVRIARGWPVWGLMLWLGCEIVLAHRIGPWTALAVSTAAVLVAGVIARIRAGRQYSRVRSMTVAVLAGYRDDDAAAARVRLVTLAAEVLEADQRLERGDITPAAHEAVWWSVYDRLPARSVSAG